MAKLRDFCLECHTNFGLAERSELSPNTCTDCLVKMRPSERGECTGCGKVLQIGESVLQRFTTMCFDCGVKQLEPDESAIHVKLTK